MMVTVDFSDYVLENYKSREYLQKHVFPINDTMKGVKINLCRDLEILSKKLLTDKYDRSTDQDATMSLLQGQRRCLPRMPRKIAKAKEFICPKICNKALQKFENMVISGENLQPYMSKKILNPEYHDKFFNDWGLYHFHLQIGKPSYKKIKISDYLLIAYLDNQTLYFIKMILHGDKDKWVKQDYIEIIHKNWPELIRRFKMPDISIGNKISNQEREKMRDLGGMVFSSLEDGTVYGPIGGGYTSDGSSVIGIMTYDKLQYKICIVEYILIYGLRSCINENLNLRNRFSKIKILDIKLLNIIDLNTFMVLETKSKTLIIVSLNKNNIGPTFSFLGVFNSIELVYCLELEVSMYKALKDRLV